MSEFEFIDEGTLLGAAAILFPPVNFRCKEAAGGRVAVM
jgi:hypothetical protein